MHNNFLKKLEHFLKNYKLFNKFQDQKLIHEQIFKWHEHLEKEYILKT
jgi:hypothetical protein